MPSADGIAEYTGTPGVVGADATHWLTFGGSGSNAGPEFSTTGTGCASPATASGTTGSS
ncbi:hypothetical protein ABT247_16000 [Kitasatospora sp. NPDC001539]|uniref:hypothetical protein n=1 Tax=Kitasatospora sp. NPDC001539 TaxID=3154384 RepID=UPI0033248E97